MRPVEYLVVEFPGNKFKGEIIPALEDLVAKSVIEVIDLVLIKKDQDGVVTSFEVDDLEEADASLFGPVANNVLGLMSAEDIQQIGDALSPNSSAGVLVFEDAWADRLLETIQNAEGIVLALDRISMDKAEEARKPESQAAG